MFGKVSVSGDTQLEVGSIGKNGKGKTYIITNFIWKVCNPSMAFFQLMSLKNTFSATEIS